MTARVALCHCWLDDSSAAGGGSDSHPRFGVWEAEMAEHGLSPLGQHVFVGKTYTQKITKINLFVRARLVQELCPVCGTVSAFGSIHKKETSALNLVPYELPSGPNTMNTFGLLSQSVHAFSRSHFRTEGCICPGRGGLPILCRCCPWLKGVT